MFSAPNYTQIPNEFFDDLAKTLKEGEMRCCMVFMRQIFGWRKQGDRISIKQLMDKTGMGRKAVVNSVKSLVQKKIIVKHKYGTPGKEAVWYSFAVSEPPPEKEYPPEDENGNPIDDSKSSYQYPKDTGGGILKIPTKETITKEKKRHPAGVKSTRQARAPHVFTSKEEHEKLIKVYGEERVDRAYKRLSEWKEDTPKSKWKKNDHLAITRWVMDALKEEERRKKKNGEVSSAIYEFLNRVKENNLNLIRKGELEILKNAVAFRKGTFYLEIPFSDPSFESKVTERIIKMGGKI